MLEVRELCRATSSVTFHVFMWLGVALKAARQGETHILIDEVAVTDTSLYRRVSALYFWEMRSKAKNFRARVAISCFQVMLFTAVLICSGGSI